MTLEELKNDIVRFSQESIALDRQRLKERVEGLKREYPENVEHPHYEQFCKYWEVRTETLDAVLKLLAEDDV